MGDVLQFVPRQPMQPHDDVAVDDLVMGSVDPELIEFAKQGAPICSAWDMMPSDCAPDLTA